MKSLLVIGYVWPEPTSSAAGTRMMQLLDFFKAQDYQITFATTASQTDAMADLPSLGISTAKIELNSPSFDEFLKEMVPEIVLFDRFMMEEQFGWRVSEICPKALKILDTEDLHFFRKARQEASKKGVELSSEILYNDTAKREIASIYRCDLTLIISRAEMELLENTIKVPSFLLLYLPFMETVPSKEDKTRLPAFEERKNFISIGNFLHQPNWDAVLHLKQHIWPLIRKELPTEELHIYGAYASQKVHQLHSEKEGFLIKGRAGSAREVMQRSKVLLAPLRFGAGLKGKFIDAMKTGTPAVTTWIGAEGMTEEGIWPGSIANDPENLAKDAIQLYTDYPKWQKAQNTGFTILGRYFSKKEFWGRFSNRIEQVIEDLRGHRRKNFTGILLQHHQMASTRHLSRYIELKNKIKDRL